MPFSYQIILLLSFLLGVVFALQLIRLSLRFKLLIPKGIPLVGGIGIGLSFSIACLIGFYLFKNFSKESIGLLCSSLVILFFGVVDDWRELSIWAKFLIQIIATALLVFFGIKTQIVYIGEPLNIIITFIWVLGITNAFNHLDVMDGLAGACAIIISLSLCLISLANHAVNTVILSLAMIGGVFAFLIRNLPPAKIYMGNAGSHFLGFVLAAIALIISYAPLERKVALLAPLLILWLPIFDTSFLMLMRIIKKNVPFNKSDDHLALRYLASGYSKKRALFAMSSLCLFFCLCGIIVSRVSNLWGFVIVTLVFIVSIVITIKMSRVVVGDQK